MNILCLAVEALRPDRLHCYGGPGETSPFIDKVASEGVLFKKVVSTSCHTVPGIVSLFTGLDPITHGIDTSQNCERWKELWKPWRTPFNLMEENGYTIAGVDAWLYNPLGYHNEVDDLFKVLEEYRGKKFFLWYNPYFTHLPYNPKPPYDTMFMPRDEVLSEETKKRLEVVKTKMIIHRPGLLSRFETEEGRLEKATHPRSAATIAFPPEDRPWILGLYDGTVRVTDEEVEKYFRKLEELDLLEDTLVVITSDHGEEILERGSLGHASCSLAGTLYDESIMVPLILRYPKILPQGKVIETQVSIVDIMPTLLEMTHLPVPRELDGCSLMPLIRGEKVEWKEEAYAETTPCGWQALKGDERKIWCVRTPRWKLIYNLDPVKGEKRYELYNLQDDPGERENLVDIEVKVAGEFRRKLHRWMGKESFLLNK